MTPSDLICSIEIVGVQATPWRASDIGSFTDGSGRRRRFSRKRGKSHANLGRLNLPDWQKLVTESAREAMDGRPPALGPVQIEYEFQFRHPDSGKWGRDAYLPYKRKHGSLVKPSLDGLTIPDITNIIKSTEDALQGVVFHDDAQVVRTFATKVFGGSGGCVVRARLLDATHESGHAEASHDPSVPAVAHGERDVHGERTRRRRPNKGAK